MLGPTFPHSHIPTFYWGGESLPYLCIGTHTALHAQRIGPARARCGKFLRKFRIVSILAGGSPGSGTPYEEAAKKAYLTRSRGGRCRAGLQGCRGGQGAPAQALARP